MRISHTGPDGNTAYRARNPAVAFNNVYNQYLVAWEADSPEAGLADNEFEIWGSGGRPAAVPSVAVGRQLPDQLDGTGR